MKSIIALSSSVLLLPSGALATYLSSSFASNATSIAISSAYASPVANYTSFPIGTATFSSNDTVFFPGPTSTVSACVVLITASPANVTESSNFTIPAFTSTRAVPSQVFSSSITTRPPHVNFTSTGTIEHNFTVSSTGTIEHNFTSTGTIEHNFTRSATAESSSFTVFNGSVSATSTDFFNFTSTFTGTVYTSANQVSTVYASAVPSGIPLCGDIVNGTGSASAPTATSNSTSGNGTSLGSNAGGNNLPGSGMPSARFSVAAVLLSSLAGVASVAL